MNIASSKHLLLVLAPDAIEARLLEKRLARSRPRLLARHAVWPASPDAFAKGLADACAAFAKENPRHADVVLSDAFCRYFMLRRPAGTARRAELDAALAARFRSLFGESPDGWTFVSEQHLWAGEELVCALPSTFQAQLLATLRQAGLSIDSIRPYWVCCAVDRAHERRHGRHWLLGGDRHALTLGLFENGRCLGAHSRRALATDEDARQWLIRETALFPPASGAPTTSDRIWTYGAVAGKLASLSEQLGEHLGISQPAAFGDIAT
jgi:hypothetical protein